MWCSFKPHCSHSDHGKTLLTIFEALDAFRYTHNFDIIRSSNIFPINRIDNFNSKYFMWEIFPVRPMSTSLMYIGKTKTYPYVQNHIKVNLFLDQKIYQNISLKHLGHGI